MERDVGKAAKPMVDLTRRLFLHAFTLDLIVLDLSGGQYQIHNLDPLAGRPVGERDLRVPKMEVGAALQKYGKSTWEFTARGSR